MAIDAQTKKIFIDCLSNDDAQGRLYFHLITCAFGLFDIKRDNNTYGLMVGLFAWNRNWKVSEIEDIFISAEIMKDLLIDKKQHLGMIKSFKSKKVNKDDISCREAGTR